VEQELAGLLGRPVVKPIDFRLALPVDDGAGRRWMSVLSALLQSADGPRGTTELRHLESPSPRRNPARSRPWLHRRRSRQDRRTSARSLQYAFHEQFGTTPMRYLRQVRLDGAREDLAQAHGSVADIAYYWGFTNLGLFARAYRDRYGEFPAETSKRGAPPKRAFKPRSAAHHR
jgi:AraC-like DNA-binding protein